MRRSGSFGMRAARVRSACAPLGFVRHARRSGSFGMRNRSGSFGMRAARFVRHPTAGVPSASHAWVRSACAPLGSFVRHARRSGSFGVRAARVRSACAALGFVRFCPCCTLGFPLRPRVPLGKGDLGIIAYFCRPGHPGQRVPMPADVACGAGQTS
jgi:hypothetical protein